MVWILALLISLKKSGLILYINIILTIVGCLTYKPLTWDESFLHKKAYTLYPAIRACAQAGPARVLFFILIYPPAYGIYFALAFGATLCLLILPYARVGLFIKYLHSHGFYLLGDFLHKASRLWPHRYSLLFKPPSLLSLFYTWPIIYWGTPKIVLDICIAYTEITYNLYTHSKLNLSVLSKLINNHLR